jgi:hypothetical protein
MCFRINYMWELWTGLYMLDASEKVVFNSLFVVLLSVVVAYAFPAVLRIVGS